MDDCFQKVIEQQPCPCGKGFIEKYTYYHEEYSDYLSSRDGIYLAYRINCPNCIHTYSFTKPIKLTQPKIDYNYLPPLRVFEIGTKYDTRHLYKAISYDEFIDNPDLLNKLNAQKEVVKKLANDYMPYTYSKEFADKLLTAIKNIPTWMYHNNIQIGDYYDYYTEYFKDAINYYMTLTNDQLVALALFDFGKHYEDRSLLEKMYNMTQQEKSIKPLLKYKEFNDLSCATKKKFNTVSIKKIAELLRLLIEIHSFYDFPQEIINQLNKYTEIGNEYYKDFDKYIKYIESNSIPVTLSDSIPDYCHR